MKPVIPYIRWLLSFLLLYGVYTETGKWTTLALFLVLINSELANSRHEINALREQLLIRDIISGG